MNNHVNKKSSKKKIFFIIFLVIVLIIGMVVGYSAAYFTASLINNSEIDETIVTTGTMSIEFTDGPQVKLDNAIPGNYVIKTFAVQNTGTLDTYYDVYLSDLVNNFEDKNDLVYTLTANTGGATISETVVPSASTKIVNKKLLPVNETHYYTLRIDFKETNDNQDDNIGKNFSAKIRVSDSI